MRFVCCLAMRLASRLESARSRLMTRGSPVGCVCVCVCVCVCRASLPRFTATPPHSVAPEPMLLATTVEQQQPHEEELGPSATCLSARAGPGPVCEGRIRVNVAGMSRKKNQADVTSPAPSKSSVRRRGSLDRTPSAATPTTNRLASAYQPSSISKRSSEHSGGLSGGSNVRATLDRLSSFQSSISAISDDVTPAAKGWRLGKLKLGALTAITGSVSKAAMKESKEKEEMLNALTRLLMSQKRNLSIASNSSPGEATRSASGSMLAKWWDCGSRGGDANAEQRAKELERRELLRSPELLDSVVQVSEMEGT
jgi:hypothetical protein